MPNDKYADMFFAAGRLAAVEFYTRGGQPEWGEAPFKRKWLERGFYYQLYFLEHPQQVAAPAAAQPDQGGD